MNRHCFTNEASEPGPVPIRTLIAKSCVDVLNDDLMNLLNGPILDIHLRRNVVNILALVAGYYCFDLVLVSGKG